jgi:hypothetical protein
VKLPKLEISKTIGIAWNEATRQKLVSFWSTRRFQFEDNSEAMLRGKRGHILWNLVTFDMTKLPASLTTLPSQTIGISVLLCVNTTFQQITEWNRAFLDFELSTCESFLLRDDLRENEWAEFLKADRKAKIIWTATMGLGGQRLPSKKDEATK